MNSISNSPFGGRADDQADQLTSDAFPNYAGRDREVWVVIAGGR